MNTQEKKKTVLVKCQTCRKSFDVIRRSHEKARMMVLNYAVCPHCKIPRFPELFKGLKKDDLCLICGIPKKKINYCDGARGLCGRCYAIERLQGYRRKYPCRYKANQYKYDK